MLHLAFEELVGHLGLREVVDAGATAAPTALGQFHELHAGDGPEQRARLGGDFLAVAEVAGVVVGDHLRISDFRFPISDFAVRLRVAGFGGWGLGRINPDFAEPLVDVLHLRVPFVSARFIDEVAFEQLGVVLEVGAAAAGVGDDGVELGGRKLVNVPAGEALGEFPFAVVRVQGAAAVLLGRGDDFAAVAREHLDGVHVHIAEDEVLRAAGEHGDTVALRAARGRDGLDEVGGKRGLDVRRHGFQFAEALRHQLHHAAVAHQPLQAELLVEAHGEAEDFQPVQVHEEPADAEGADGVALRVVQHAAGLGLGAGVLEQLGVVHARRAGGHAREAAEAEIHFVGEGLRRLKLAVGDGAHEGDAAARGVALELGGVVGRAGGQAEAAVHALLHDGVVEVFEMGEGRGHDGSLRGELLRAEAEAGNPKGRWRRLRGTGKSGAEAAAVQTLARPR